jgi:hypothetical protein
MQSEWSNVFRKRLLVNGSKAVVRQLDRNYLKERAKPYKELKPVYFLAVVNGRFSKGKDWYHHLKITDPKNPDVVLDGLDYVLLELPNFTPETWSHAHKKLAVLWLRFLKEIVGYYEKLPEEFESNELIHSAIKICEYSSFSPKELLAYDDAETQAMWDASIKELEDEVLESRKVLAEKDKEIEELKKQLGKSEL